VLPETQQRALKIHIMLEKIGSVRPEGQKTLKQQVK